MSRRNPLSSWFAIRRDLEPGRQRRLALLSFLIPLGIWCFFSYVPGPWISEIRFLLSADEQGAKVVFTVGDRRSLEEFTALQGRIREENIAVLTARGNGEKSKGMASRLRRANKKVLRKLAPVAINEGWLKPDQDTDDAAIYEIWRELAQGERTITHFELSAENQKIVEENWKVLSAISSTYESKLIPTEPLLKLIPQGKRSTPFYLPAPHEVLQSGWRDWHAEPENDKPSMSDRLSSSVQIVFGGFLLSCLLGIPLGILCGTYDFFSRLFEPFIDFFRYMPAPTFSPLLVALCGMYSAPKILLVFVGTFFQMVLVIAKTTRLLDRSLIEAAQTLGARRIELLRKVIIPGILPQLYNDMRILLGWAWTWLVIAELIGEKSGLTEFIQTQGRFHNFDRVYPVIIMIGVIGFFTDQLLAWFRRYLFPYTGEEKVKEPGFFGRAIDWLIRDRLPAQTERSAT